MTPDDIIEQAKLMTKYAESVKAGKPIQLQWRYRDERQRCGYDEFHDISDPIEYFIPSCEYREKPREPRRWKARVDSDGELYQCGCCNCGAAMELIEVVEVLKEGVE